MEEFTTLTGIAAPLPRMNVDTDMIIPKQHLKTIKRTGLGKVLFDELRFQDNGEEIADFILNQSPYREAKILITGENFGCGSSREHAPWALLDFGIRCIIAPSFADIFLNNCFKNGILPIALAGNEVDTLMADANHPDRATMTVDLPEQTIQRSNGETLSFTVDEFRKHCLLNGLDDISLTLKQEDKIAEFEQQQQQKLPWLWANR